MIGQSQLKLILYVSAVLSAGLLLLTWFVVPSSAPASGPTTQGLQLLYKGFSSLIAIANLAAIIFDKWAWSWPIIRSFWTRATPDIRGTWKGEILSSWIDPQTNQGIPPIEAYLAIRQTWSTLSLRLITKESRSKLVSGSFVPDSDGTCTIAGIYQNEPSLLLREKSPIHYGALLLHVCGTSPYVLTGHYWTDRKSQGEIRFSLKSATVHHNFEGATADAYKGSTATNLQNGADVIRNLTDANTASLDKPTG